ncbi:MAG: alkyl sulfatase dimerization domain-containing protein [Burkholderiaceae bacterium]
MAGTDILMQKNPAVQWAPGVWTIGGQGNSLAVSNGDGLVLVDAGPGKEVTARMISHVRAVSELPVTHIVYSHGHVGYNNGAEDWFDEARARGDRPPCVVAHERLPHRYRRYRETGGLQALTHTRQFRSPYPADPPARWFRMPDVTFRDEHVIPGRTRDVVVMHAPSETDDAVAVWLPDVKLLWGGCAFIKSLPNAGSPFRTFRDPIRWAGTLERFLAMEPAILVPEFGKPLTDAAEIREALSVPAKALRWLRAQVVERMNRGMGELEILRDVELPAELFANRYMKPGYGCPDYLIREIWRSENGWWDRNPTSLHPSRPQAAADARYDALPDPARVLAKARALADAGEVQRALQVVDLLVAAAPSPQRAQVGPARELKAALLDRRAAQMTSAVSRQVMQSDAEMLRGQAIGDTDRARGDTPFEWT